MSKEETTQLNQPGETNARAPDPPQIPFIGGVYAPSVLLNATRLREWLAGEDGPRPCGWPALAGGALLEERMDDPAWQPDRLRDLALGAAELAEAGKLSRADWRGTHVFGRFTAEKLEAAIAAHRGAEAPRERAVSTGSYAYGEYRPEALPTPEPEPAGEYVPEAGFLRKFLVGGGDV